MKTFLWTTLFWIVVAIAGLLCLGFGNLGTQVLDNSWLAKVMPDNVQASACDSVVATALESIDRCAAADAKGCYPTTVDAEDNNESEFTLADVVANQQVIYNYLQESFAGTNQAINNIQLNNIQDTEEVVVDEKEQQRLQIQAQIEALQNEMANLY